MLFSTSIHPSMHTSFILKTSKSPLNNRKTSRVSPTSTATTPFACASTELFLLSMLQGCESMCCERVRVEAEIAAMGDDAKKDLIDFLQRTNGAACAAVENNACKQLTCAATGFCDAFYDESCAEKLLQVWERLYKDIIPVMEDILFPLAQHDADFSIRLVVMRFFRDRVLLKCLDPVEFRVPELEPILFTLLVETHDDSDEYEVFARVAQRVMACDERDRSASQTENDEYPHVCLRKSASAEVIKCRSRTLPNKRKSVQWEDMRKSNTVSNF